MPVDVIQERIITVINHENIEKKAIMVHIIVQSRLPVAEFRKIMRMSFRIVDISANIKTEHLSNINLEYSATGDSSSVRRQLLLRIQ
jgi:hypothetical protein